MHNYASVTQNRFSDLNVFFLGEITEVPIALMLQINQNQCNLLKKEKYNIDNTKTDRITLIA